MIGKKQRPDPDKVRQVRGHTHMLPLQVEQKKMSVTAYIQNLKSSAGIAGDVGELLGQIDELHSKKLACEIV